MLMSTASSIHKHNFVRTVLKYICTLGTWAALLCFKPCQQVAASAELIVLKVPGYDYVADTATSFLILILKRWLSDACLASTLMLSDCCHL